MKNRGGIYHYVPHPNRAEWEAQGWVHAADLGSPHSEYSSLYKWAGEGKPVIPYSAEERDKQLNELDYIWPDPIGGDGD